jgi:hypothetical protein
MADWTCSRCGSIFTRENEFSLLGYRQCLSCDFNMFEAKGKGEPWPEPDDPWHACAVCSSGENLPPDGACGECGKEHGRCWNCGRPHWRIDVVIGDGGNPQPRYERRDASCS